MKEDCEQLHSRRGKNSPLSGGLLFNLKSASLKSPTTAGTLLPIYSVQLTESIMEIDPYHCIPTQKTIRLPDFDCKKKRYERTARRYGYSLDALTVNGFYRIQAERTPSDQLIMVKLHVFTTISQYRLTPQQMYFFLFDFSDFKIDCQKGTPTLLSC